MEVKQRAEELIKKYTKVQGDLYHQIERVEHSINLLKLRHQEKIEKSILYLNDYKDLLSAHAYYVDMKLSVLTKESNKADATIQSLEEINKKLYDGQTSIEMPKELAESLGKFGIKFGKDDIVNLKADCASIDQESDYSL